MFSHSRTQCYAFQTLTILARLIFAVPLVQCSVEENLGSALSKHASCVVRRLTIIGLVVVSLGVAIADAAGPAPDQHCFPDLLVPPFPPVLYH